MLLIDMPDELLVSLPLSFVPSPFLISHERELAITVIGAGRLLTYLTVTT